MISKRYDVVIVGAGIVGTYIARLLTRQGKRVALIDCGPRSVNQMQSPSPSVECGLRNHLGLVRARNHVVGGNGFTWGGGLLRASSRWVGDCLGFPDGALGTWKEEMGEYYAEVEHDLGFHRCPSRRPFMLKGKSIGYEWAEIFVLLGKNRNVSEVALDEFFSSGLGELYTSAHVTDFDVSPVGHVRSIMLRSGENTFQFEADEFVISAGAIDSILLLKAHSKALRLADSERLGCGLHEHFSIPLFTLKTEDGSEFFKQISPHFEHGKIIGGRVELTALGDWDPKAFLHFQFNFDDCSPYSEIKGLLESRQQGLKVSTLFWAVVNLAPHLLSIVKIGWERFIKGRLYIAPDVPVIATLDFESFPSVANCLHQRTDDRQQMLNWDLQPEDEVAFNNLFTQCEQIIAQIVETYGVTASPAGCFNSSDDLLNYFHRDAIDAFHLGGGAKVGIDAEDGVVDKNLLVRGLDNLHIISSAVFRRAGGVNPTLTLLALANRFCKTISNKQAKEACE